MDLTCFSYDAVAAQPHISDLDVVRMRDAFTFDGPITEHEARVLMLIEQAHSAKPISWKGFFLDAMLEYAIHTATPDGYLTADNADWLLREAAPAGRILTANMFELLSALLSSARWAPQRLVSALMDEVYCAIASGNGPLRHSGDVPPGIMTERDVEITRRILYASGLGIPRSIDKAEVAGLLAIDAACAEAPLLTSWADLFCKAMYDAAMSASGHSGPSRERTLAYIEPGIAPASLIDTLAARSSLYLQLTAEERSIAALERQRLEIVTGDDVEPCTAEWFCHAFAFERPGTPAYAILFEALSRQPGSLDPAIRAFLSLDCAVLDDAVRAA